MAEYGDLPWLDAQAEAQIVAAWLRRKRLEARLVAVEVGKLFGGEGGHHAGEPRVSGAELLRTAGISL